MTDSIKLDALDTFIYRGLDRKHFEVPPGNYDPALIIGLGGTGVTVLRQLKACIGNAEMPAVRLLAIDSASDEFLPTGEPPYLKESEQVLMEPSIATRALDLAASGDPGYRHILDYLPKEAEGRKDIHAIVRTKVETGQGAGQFRRAGRLVFNSNIHNGAKIKKRILQIKDELVGAGRQNRESRSGLRVSNKMQVFVVCSSSGGTGAGVLIDMLALLRSVFEESQYRIHVILALPGSALDRKVDDPVVESVQTRANTLGLLRELQAFHHSEVKDMTFHFAPHDRYVYKGDRHLFHSLTVLDQQRMDGTSIEEWEELKRAAAYYLYSIVGTGMGANQNMGGINADKLDSQGWIRTMGISSLEVPEMKCRSVVIRELYEAFAARVVHEKQVSSPAGEKVGTVSQLAETELKAFLQRHNLSSASAMLQNAPRPNGFNELFEFYDTEAAQKNLLGKHDNEFLRTSSRAMSVAANEVKRFDEALEASTGEWMLQVADGLDEELRSKLPVSLPLASKILETLDKQVDRLQKAVLKHIEVGMRDKEANTADMEALARKINFWDFGLDKKYRRTYIQKTQDQLVLERETRLLKECLTFLDGLDGAIRELQAKVTSMLSKTRLLRLENKDRLQALYRASANPIFVHDSIGMDEFKKVWEKQGFQVSSDFVTGQYDHVALFFESVGTGGSDGDDLEDAFQKVFSTLNVIEQAKKSRPGKDKLSTLQLSSGPLFGLSPTAPMPGDLKPLHYLAGSLDEAADGEWLNTLFPTEQAALNLVDTGDPDRAIYVRTQDHLSPSHWKQLEAAMPLYRELEWRSHVLPHHENLPPLTPFSKEMDHALETFCLALAMDAIHVRGSNYYINLRIPDRAGDRAPCQLGVYSKNRSPICQKLLQAGFLKEAQSSRTRTRPADALGQGLDSAVDKLKEPVSYAFVEEVRNLILEDFRNSYGEKALRDSLTEYANGELDALIVKSQGDRRDLLQQMQERIQGLVSNLSG